MGFNIAIDGPAGAGKSTIARAVAKELSFLRRYRSYVPGCSIISYGAWHHC